MSSAPRRTPLTNALCHLIREFCLLVCTTINSYINSSRCVVQSCFAFDCLSCILPTRSHKMLLCFYLGRHSSVKHYCLEYTPHHTKHTWDGRSTSSGPTTCKAPHTHPVRVNLDRAHSVSQVGRQAGTQPSARVVKHGGPGRQSRERTAPYLVSFTPCSLRDL